MTAPSHIAVSSATVVAAADTYLLAKDDTFPAVIGGAVITVGRFLTNRGSLPAWAFFAMSALFFFLGCLLPDADHEFSPIGKIFHVPLAHRTWLHSIWFVLLFAVPGIWFRPLMWLAIGCGLHIFYDMFSMSGIHWFYPWKKKKHWLKLYHTGAASEYIIMTLLVLGAIMYTVMTVHTLWIIPDIIL